QLLDHRKGALGVGHQRRLVHDAVVGDGDFLDVLLRGGVARDHGVVEAVHTHGDGAGAFDVGLLQQHDLQAGVLFLGGHRRHGSGSATADDQNVGINYGNVVDLHVVLLFPVNAELVFEGVAAIAEVFEINGPAIPVVSQAFHPQDGVTAHEVQVP